MGEKKTPRNKFLVTSLNLEREQMAMRLRRAARRSCVVEDICSSNRDVLFVSDILVVKIISVLTSIPFAKNKVVSYSIPALQTMFVFFISVLCLHIKLHKHEPVVIELNLADVFQLTITDENTRVLKSNEQTKESPHDVEETIR